jgi:hypothetical protein
MDATAPFSLTYSFDYDRFAKPDLEIKAKSTLGNFLGFVRQTFDGLLSIGRSLQDLYYDCIAFCPNGKKVFSEWLDSEDFGASRYIASSAMEISAWFDKLPPKVQHIIRKNVQQWSVSALLQLTKVSHDLVKELVRTGKKTAAQVKKEGESGRAGEGEKSNSIPPSSISSLKQSSTPELTPGIRVVVTGNDAGWNGYTGIIMSKREGDFWVLLDLTVAQGMQEKHLLKPHQIQPESQHQVTKPASSKEVFTEAQVEQKIASALAQREREKAQSEQGRFIEIRDAALEAAKREIQAAQQHAQAMTQAKEALIEQLAAKEEEMRSLQAKLSKNQQLEQRVAELEKALENSSANNWGNTFSQQAAKVINSDLEKTISPLMSEVDRLSSLLSQREQELSQVQVLNKKQHEELQRTSTSDSIVAEFGEIGERFGWSGWSRRGYRAASGMLCTGVNAISAFISDLKSSHLLINSKK